MTEREPDKNVSVYSIVRTAEALEEVRQDWIGTLAKNPEHSEAAARILSLSAKIEILDDLLRGAYVFRGINYRT